MERSVEAMTVSVTVKVAVMMTVTPVGLVQRPVSPTSFSMTWHHTAAPT